MSEKKSVKATTAAVSESSTGKKTKTAEKAAHELAERKMAELVYAENYRQKLREEKAAKKSAEVKEAERKAAEKREAEAKERRAKMEALLQQEREELEARSAKANAVLQKVELESEAPKQEKPEPAKKAAPAPKAPVYEAPKTALKEAPAAQKATLKAPIGSYIPFTPKTKKPASPRPAPKFEAKKVPTFSTSYASRPAYRDYLYDYTVNAGHDADYVTLDELFHSYEADYMKPDLNSKEVRELLDAQKQQAMKEMDDLYDRFMELYNDQKGNAEDYLANADMIRSLVGELRSSYDNPQTLDGIAEKLQSFGNGKDQDVANLCASLIEMLRAQRAAFDENLRDIEYLRNLVKTMKSEEAQKADDEEPFDAEDAFRYAEESFVPFAEENPKELEEDDFSAEPEESFSAEPEEVFSAEPEAKEAVSLDEEKENEADDVPPEDTEPTAEAEDALWVEEPIDGSAFAVVPEDLKGLSDKVIAKYLRNDLKHLRQDVKEQRAHLRVGKNATPAEIRRADYEAIALCRMSIENYAVLLKVALQYGLDVSGAEDGLDKEIKLERKLVKKLNKAANRNLTPVPKNLVEDLLSETYELAPCELYRKDKVKA